MPLSVFDGAPADVFSLCRSSGTAITPCSHHPFQNHKLKQIKLSNTHMKYFGWAGRHIKSCQSIFADLFKHFIGYFYLFFFFYLSIILWETLHQFKCLGLKNTSRLQYTHTSTKKASTWPTLDRLLFRVGITSASVNFSRVNELPARSTFVPQSGNINLPTETSPRPSLITTAEVTLNKALRPHLHRRSCSTARRPDSYAGPVLCVSVSMSYCQF